MRALSRFASRRAGRRDPAPSRWAYRLHRLWLTPVFRALLRVGLPAFAVALAVGLFLGNAQNGQMIRDKIAEVRRSIETRPEFMVQMMTVDGASPDLAEAIRSSLGFVFPLSSFDIDLTATQGRIEALDAVASAAVRVRPGGVLEVKITEREPAIIWRSATGLELLDATGHRVAGLTDRAARPDLPVIAGEEADKAVPEALVLIATAAPIAARLRGLERIGARRWDLVLDREQRIMLPEDAPVPALERALALARAQDLLGRDVLAVDLRNAARPTLRLTPGAYAEFQKTRGPLAGATKS